MEQYSIDNCDLSVQVYASHYNFSDYVNLPRWNSYWHQIMETIALNPKNVLIIGAGDNIVGKILMTQGMDVYTFDFDKTLQPDYTGNITDIDTVLQGKHFDLILCCQVLEHLPYDNFENILRKCKLLADNMIISLPYSPIYFEIDINMTRIGYHKIKIDIHHFFRKLKWNGQHYWEIGWKGYTKQKIRKNIKKIFFIKKQFVAKHNHCQIFFVLRDEK
jgi:hypothetical protein